MPLQPHWQWKTSSGQNECPRCCAGRSGAKLAADTAGGASNAFVTDSAAADGLLMGGAAPPPQPRSSKGKKPLPAVSGAISYKRWRSKYVRTYQDGLYVAYNGKHREEPANAVTVSEVGPRYEPPHMSKTATAARSCCITGSGCCDEHVAVKATA